MPDRGAAGWSAKDKERLASEFRHARIGVRSSARTVSTTEQPAQTRDVVQAVKALNATEICGQENELVFQTERQAKQMVVQIVNRQTKERRWYRKFPRSTFCVGVRI